MKPDTILTIYFYWIIFTLTVISILPAGLPSMVISKNTTGLLLRMPVIKVENTRKPNIKWLAWVPAEVVILGW